ncbi:MAG: hypothetical protein ABR563_03600 [Pyrinomonadaceae bacterium]
MADEREMNQPGGANETPREREATSDETLDDLERTQDAVMPKSGGGARSGGARSETNAPSPDGAFDEQRGGRADGSDAGEPV